jgi:hypothetical protein
VVEIGSFFTSLFKPRGQFTVTTPTSVASVKGTSWWTIQLGDGRTIYIVIDDMIDCENDAGKFLVREGQTAIFSSSSLPPEINLTDDSQIPTWDEGFGTRQILEIEFENPEGEKQRLKIDYQTQ